MLVKNPVYTGVCTTTFSSAVASFLTVEDMAGITPVQNTSQSLCISKPCLSFHHLYMHHTIHQG
jgi:hypothetical protein